MKKQLTLLSICLLTSAVVLAGVSKSDSVLAEEIVVIDDKTFDDSYSYNSVLNIPDYKNVYFYDESGMNKATYGEILFPDGNSKIPGRYVLDLPGKYQIRYYSQNGKSFQKEFLVNKNIYETGNGVTAQYCDAMPKSNKPGISVNLVSGSSFKINKYANIHDFAGQLVDVVTFYPLLREGTNDIPAASFSTVKLVDAYDSSKFIEYYVWSSSESNVYYSGAGAAFQNFTGLEYNTNRPDKINCVFEGVSYIKHVTTRYQSVDAYGVWFGGKTNNKTTIDSGGISFTWDLIKNQAWISGSDAKLITDFDANEVYDSNLLNIDDYFTTGEVYAQFECFGFNTTSMDIEIESVLGFSGEELKNAIVYDVVAPSIINDFTEEGQNVSISQGEKFYIPELNIFDFNYYGDVKTNVYYNYGQVDQFLVSSSDYFIPDLLGKYSLVYIAKDGYGNTNKEVITLNSTDKKPFNFIENKLSSLSAASENNVPILDVIGNNGKVNVEANAIDPSGKRNKLYLNSDSSAYSLVPLYVGKYTIEYIISDNFYTTNFSYEVSSNDVGAVYFNKKPALYPYYIKDAAYSLEAFKGVKATVDGPQEIKTIPYMSLDKAQYKAISNPDEFYIKGNENIRFKFIVGSTNYESDLIDIVDVGYGLSTSNKDYFKYFQGNYSSTEEKLSSLSFAFDDDIDLSFINTISVSKFLFDLYFDLSATNSIDIKLEDYKDSNNYLKLEVEKMTSIVFKATLIQCSSGDIAFQNGYFNVSNEDMYSYHFNLYVLGNKLYFNDTVNLPFEHDFELGVLSVNSNGKSTIDIARINNQNFQIKSKMSESPAQGYFERKTGSFEVGSDFTVSTFKASAVLTPILNSDVRLIVTDSNDNIARSIDGELLNEVTALKYYTINLKEVGRYKFTYVTYANLSKRSGFAKERDDNTFFVVSVDDVINPTIKFVDHSTLTVNVGDIIKIREYEIADNYTEKDKLLVKTMVLDEGNNIIESGYGVTQIALRRPGTFKVLAYVFDEYGNYSTDYYLVVVRV